MTDPVRSTLLLLGAVVACAATTSPEHAVLQSFPVGAHSAARYEVGFGECADARCPVEVRLADDHATLAREALDWPAVTTETYEADIDPISGVGDPLAPPKGTLWVAGEDESSLSVFARPVRLTAERNGLLVDEAAGFDHVKRRHYLFVERDGSLARVWTGSEGQGPVLTTTAVRGSADGTRDEIVYFDQVRFPFGDAVDELTVTSLRWDAAQAKLSQSPASGIYAVVFGPFADVNAARNVAAEHPECFAEFSILPSERFVSLPAGSAVLAAVTAAERNATETLSRVGKCATAQRGKVLEVR